MSGDRAPARSDAPVALVDLDGTLADYHSAMERDLLKIRGPGCDTAWHDGAPAYMIERKKLIQDQPGWWLGLAPLPLGMALLAMLGDVGFRQMILTKGPSKRNSAAWTEKVLWCRRHVPGVPVTVTEDKALVYGAVLVDDWPEYIAPWLAHRPRGLVLMPAQPWNAHWGHPQVLRVTEESLPEARELASAAAARIRGEE